MKTFIKGGSAVAIGLSLGYLSYKQLSDEKAETHYAPNSTFLSSLETGDTLKAAAQGTGVYIGAALNQRYLKLDASYGELAAREYDLVTEENGCKMTQIAKGYDDIDLSKCLYTANFAKANGMAMRGHTLIWGAPTTAAHSHNPQFIVDETDPAKLESFMEEYINLVLSNVTHPFAWDVVNEAVADGPNLIQKVSPWSIVDDYVCKAFKMARKANPNIELFYNDYKHASSAGKYERKSNKVYEFVKNMTERGCPIDGVGFQSHLDIDYDDVHFESIRKNIQRYAALGLKVHFTEVDVRCNQVNPQNCPFSSGQTWSIEAQKRQAIIYRNLLQVCLDEPNCTSFESWGFTDKYCFLKSPQDPFPFDINMEKKLAYYEMLNTLNDFKVQKSK